MKPDSILLLGVQCHLAGLGVRFSGPLGRALAKHGRANPGKTRPGLPAAESTAIDLADAKTGEAAAWIDLACGPHRRRAAMRLEAARELVRYAMNDGA